MGKKFPCGICNKSVRGNQKGLLCTCCKKWIHLSCTDVSVNSYDDRSQTFTGWECSSCLMKHLAFNIFSPNTSGGGNIYQHSNETPEVNQGLKYSELLNSKGIKFVQLNIVSLIKNLEELKMLLYDNDIHVCALNETRLDGSINDNEVDIPHYTVVRKDRDRRGGGVAVYIHESINYERLDHESVSNLEAILISLKLKNAKPLLLMNWYRPPNSKSDIFDSYEEVLTFIEAFNCSFIMLGDINIDISKILSNDKKRYCQINDIHGLHQINTTEHTRVTCETATLVDHMVTNCINKVKSFGVIHNGLSDHSMSYLIWKTHHSLSKSHYITFRKSKGLDIEAFVTDLKAQNWSEVQNCDTINESLAKWEELLLEIVNHHMPMKTKRVRKQHSPWLTEHVFKLIKERDKVKAKARLNKSETYWKQYKRLKNKVTLMIRKCKKKYFAEKLSQCNDRNQSWKVLKSFMPNKSSSSSFSHDKQENAELAKDFNTHFSSIAEKLRSCFDDVPQPSKANSSKLSHEFMFSSVNEEDVLKLIYSLKNTKSAGVDDINSFILKTSAPVIVKPLTYLINRSLSEGIFPSKWKTAKIIPVFKKGDKTSPDNYRPISLLTCASKILEKVVQKQIVCYLRTYCILSKEQSGFRVKHSTQSALIKVTDEWLRALDNGEYTGCLFVDLQKAFDMVDHQILLQKLESIGIIGTPLSWFRSYLTDRKIVTSINNVSSGELPLKYGVPQGSLLGPLLFLIFINDLPKCFDKCSLHLYADDTVIYYSGKNVNTIQSTMDKELKYLATWMRLNKLKVNCGKTVSMLIGTKHMLAKRGNLNLNFNGVNLSQVKCFKYLGVHVDDELKWTTHTEHVCKKTGKMISYLGRLKHVVNASTLKTVYNTAILPHFDYADIVWQSATKSSLIRIQKLQNRAARIILKVKPYEHKSVAVMHDLLDWEMLNKRRKKHMLSLVYKILHNMAPEYLLEKFDPKVSTYDLRNSGALALPKPRTENCKRTFVYCGSTHYNDLSLSIKQATSVIQFNKMLNELNLD